jgi:hypothetical protein
LIDTGLAGVDKRAVSQGGMAMDMGRALFRQMDVIDEKVHL